ncbi:MAG: CRISPR-associated endonuclease Cas2 [Blastocatellia bacterium]|nr:CRISPR-associated endonuclease Cas2 [Blastocatellia bacterium]
MLILVTYDVSTETETGKKRLRKVAKVCTNYGQRVQKSVFECRVTQAQKEELERKLLAIIEVTEDNLRLYRLVEPIDKYVKEYGNFRAVDFEKPLIA